VANYGACDFLRMAWRNLDGSIRCIAAGEVDVETADKMINTLNRIQDRISKMIADIHGDDDDDLI